MNAIYWHMNATLGGANLHPGVNLLPGANLHPGANCAHEHGFRCNYTKFQLKILIVFRYVLNFPRVPSFLPILL